MSNLTVVESVYTGPGNRFSGISDFEFYTKDGQTFLILGNEGTSDLKLYYIYANGGTTLRHNLKLGEDTGTVALNDLEPLSIAGVSYFITSGRYDDSAGLIKISGRNSTSLNSPTSVTGDASDYAYFETTHTVYIEDQVYVLATKRNDAALLSFHVGEDLEFNEKQIVTDGGNNHLGDITDITSTVVDDKVFVAVISAFDGGLDLFRMGRHGNLHQRFSIEPETQSGFSYAQKLVTAQIGDITYLVMGAAGSDSLTVFRIGEKGRLVEVDHIIDSLHTRFEGVSELTVVETAGRAFVFAAGSDDGLSVFELMPNGTLRWVVDYEDDFEVALTNISAIEITEIEGEIHVFVASAVEDGFTQFTFTPDEIGLQLIGTNAKDILTGGAEDDHLYGFRQGDQLFGGAGDDILDGGQGKDYLTGGAGADIFVFIPDKRTDVILDYEQGIDLIDLSAYALIESVNDFEIKSREYGAIITIRNEKIRIETDDGQSLSAEDFSADDFIF
ncbi:hypothetical protein GCM10007939_07700 [Amylibacter marinus]|uniref:Hemolysin-type calcium-binding repeat-containing protein n=1 Tax=Amylibacter marinus TaxID=1475483 RepID=A0ABQ5VTJ4_9RHOB|nr:hypothetical protein [Amylibacter marinus]GLQ34487.1 hypothetical protein GCM10007939_07700 [Amylibacter marinus]